MISCHPHKPSISSFEQCLDKLFQRRLECGETVISTTKYQSGSCLTVTMVCSERHVCKWNSQPMVNNIPAGNLILPAAILSSGCTFAKFSQLAAISKLQSISSTAFYRIQDMYLFPAVSNAWEQHQEAALAFVAGQPLELSGDARCDSPGHSAKYCTYSLMDQRTNTILDFQLVQFLRLETQPGWKRLD